MYKTIYAQVNGSFEVNKSEFIGYIKPCNTEEEALEFIEKIKTKHKDATHNCFAYIIGKDKLIQRFSDDGEPSGTAGIPMLEVLKKEDLTDICIVATRYFGGIKLGAGGLVRAYSKSVRVALEESTIVIRQKFYKLKLIIDYTYIGSIENFIAINDIQVINKEYLEKVSIELYYSIQKTNEFKKNMNDLTSGTMNIDIIDDVYLSTKNNKIIL